MSQQNYKCPECKKKVTDEDHALCCELCDNWYHIKCKNIQETVYKMLTDDKNSNIHWFCTTCDKDAIANIKLISDLKVNQAKTEQEVVVLRTEVEILKKENADFKDRLLALENKPFENGVILQNKVERMEVFQRMRNLVLFNLSEDEEEGSDEKSVKDILNVLNLSDVNFELMGRIGKVNNNYPRLLRISLNKQVDRSRILSVTKNLKTKRKYEKVYISPDLTRIQQVEGKKLREELKNRTTNGERNLRIKGGKIIVSQM